MEEDLTASRVATSRLDAGACFDRPARWAAWLKCEAALAMAEAEIGIIPTLAGKMIAECCDASLLNADNIARAMEVQEHALTPVLDELGRVIREQVAKHQSAGGAAGEKPTMTPDEIAGYLHWGATTQNITQTGFVLNLRRAHSAILDSVAKYVAVIGRLCRDKAELVMPGRTHGQQALPVTFGYKCAAWLDELLRHAERLCQSADRLFRAIREHPRPALLLIEGCLLTRRCSRGQSGAGRGHTPPSVSAGPKWPPSTRGASASRPWLSRLETQSTTSRSTSWCW